MFFRDRSELTRTFLNGNPKASLLPFSPHGIALKINGVACGRAAHMRSLDSAHAHFRNKWQSSLRGSAGLDGFG